MWRENGIYKNKNTLGPGEYDLKTDLMGNKGFKFKKNKYRNHNEKSKLGFPSPGSYNVPLTSFNTKGFKF